MWVFNLVAFVLNGTFQYKMLQNISAYHGKPYTCGSWGNHYLTRENAKYYGNCLVV